MSTRIALGRLGEDAAARGLVAQGWTILDRNWRCRLGEVDIVAQDGDDLVIVEVKTRRSGAFGTPEEAVTRAKLTRLRCLAAAWLASQERRFGGVRIDVVAVRFADGAASVDHLKGVG
jgi:putative endonuclease